MIHQKSFTSWSSLYSYRAHNQQIQLKNTAIQPFKGKRREGGPKSKGKKWKAKSCQLLFWFAVPTSKMHNFQHTCPKWMVQLLKESPWSLVCSHTSCIPKAPAVWKLQTEKHQGISAANMLDTFLICLTMNHQLLIWLPTFLLILQYTPWVWWFLSLPNDGVNGSTKLGTEMGLLASLYSLT